jgi:hypothetical protein
MKKALFAAIMTVLMTGVVPAHAIPPEIDFGDAPEGALAYLSPAVLGSFPTCITVGPLSWIDHTNFGAFFGPMVDFEPDGNGGLCPVFGPYDADECFMDGDAGLLYPQAYTIDPTPAVVPCPSGQAPPALGLTCQPAAWGANVDIDVSNFMPSSTLGYVNVFIDWNQDGFWGGSSTCPDGSSVPEHVLQNFFPVPNPFAGPLSVLAPPGFLIGPNPGYVWVRFSITERPVSLPWDGSGSFEDGESEDYLLLVDAEEEPVGACCYPDPPFPYDSFCTETTQTYCEQNLSGVYEGDGSVCLGMEACCLPDGTCTMADALCCLNELGGSPQGPGAICSQATEGCCLPDGTCADLDPLCCIDQGGTPQGPGTACTQPEACCLPDGTCQDLDPLCCEDLQGSSSPTGAQACLGDTNQNGTDDACEEEVPPEPKWLQPPDLTELGIDVNATYPFILADDFLCTETGPLTEIHIWASWLSDILPFDDPAAVTFTLSIHEDIPAFAPGNPWPWSIPGETLWVGSPPFTVELFAQGPEGWLDPPDIFTPPPADTMCWEYIFSLDPSQFIQQGTPSEPVIYWLDVRAHPMEAVSSFGWKTTTPDYHWNDDAAWTITDLEEPLPSPWFDWYELLYPLGQHPYEGLSIDLAFAIYSESAQATGACCYPDPIGPGTLCTVTNQADCEQTLSGVYKEDGTVCLDDSGDGDGIVEPCDNCPNYPNGPITGTCTLTTSTNRIVSTGQVCNVDGDCDPGEFCEKVQADTYPPGGNGIGDACDCEGNFNCDTNVDATDVAAFLTDFGRSIFFNPCTNAVPCDGDFLCDVDVDAGDVTKFLEDFGRSTYFFPCPICDGSAWCSYP